ncbi:MULTISPECIES: ABC transporter ATP-binding protein [Rhizobium]|uniref:ABC transporter ATP-binding protein n=1 Tax=Rhizobium anhuiense TaxID=1184720 RepID=A0A3S0Q0F2_9HYPH|nr:MULTISPECIES: ABC transporter ATP-binding protein [Rhizobium]KZS53563.1 ABC transporter ATP-binding protein [Rhizobium anhuiense bv. trifolii]MBB3301852.1 branched-chain amino acid transport system ATP-binding protein [Rhizobium sp. BK112]MBB3371157.1 branched-chain amino acid transport system ATP-binding protein [Rhizobium sp. BK077]MBB3746340.1 branched-chain amino acid transport system ATP-binding protein [Rhizobium sp. BK591]MBB4181925.1 branched-chain amino acid transport system ATP-bi
MTLDLKNLSVFYGKTQALFDCSFSVGEGEFVALLGSNGAGKTTLLRAVSGLLPFKGSIAFSGMALDKIVAQKRLALGIAHIPQGRGTFSEFTVDENLSLGATIVSNRSQVREDKDRWYETFPRLRERRDQLAGNLSGGEQQMLAVARALMSRPKLLMCDEPSLGLAPSITQEILAIFKTLNKDHGMTLLVVEQNVDITLQYADRAFVIEAGQIVASGAATELIANEDIKKSYLGVA